MLVKCLTGRIATLLILTSLLGACATDYSRPVSSQTSANTNYHVNNSTLAVGLNLFKYNSFKMSKAAQQKHVNSIYIALQNLDNGEQIDWVMPYDREEGHIRVLTTYSYGDGYCRELDVLVTVKSKTRSYMEKGCYSSTSKSWTFLR
jgi:surface antigen